jgi:hypothetical protein
VIAKQMFVLVFYGANSVGKDTKNQCFTPENGHLMKVRADHAMTYLINSLSRVVAIGI